MKFLLPFLFLLFSQTGCFQADRFESGTVKPQVQYRAGSNKVEMLESKRVKLTVPAGSPPMAVNSFQMAEGKMYLLDIAGLQQAFIFDELGSLVKKVGQPGPGPGEYRFPGGFCFTGSRIHIIASGQYIVYDENGNFSAQKKDTKKVGIGQKIYPAPNGGAFYTLYSRHTPKATVFHVDPDGTLLGQYSAPDKDLLLLWDEVTPAGLLVIEEDRIAHVFVHRYEVIFYNSSWEQVQTIQLHSFIYREPDYVEARKLSSRKDKYHYLQKYSLITGFYGFGDNYVTALAHTTLEKDRVYLEFWDRDFWGLGRWMVPEGETLVGSSGSDLVFYDAEEFTLIFRHLP